MGEQRLEAPAWVSKTWRTVTVTRVTSVLYKCVVHARGYAVIQLSRPGMQRIQPPRPSCGTTGLPSFLQPHFNWNPDTLSGPTTNVEAAARMAPASRWTCRVQCPLVLSLRGRVNIGGGEGYMFDLVENNTGAGTDSGRSAVVPAGGSYAELLACRFNLRWPQQMHEGSARRGSDTHPSYVSLSSTQSRGAVCNKPVPSPRERVCFSP